MDTQMLIGSSLRGGRGRQGAGAQPAHREAHRGHRRGLDRADRCGGRTRPRRRSRRGRARRRRSARAISSGSPMPSRRTPRAFAALEALNCGKPINAVTQRRNPGDRRLLAVLRGRGARRCTAQVAGEYLPGHTSMIRRDPIGIVASIAPWNYPLMMMAWKLAPALAGGNTVVFKPSEQTPLTALKLAKVMADILPEGVFNLVLGRGRQRRQRADQPPQGRDDLDHRRHRHRQEGAARPRRKIGEAHASRARRQGAGDRLRRRRPRRGGQRPQGLRLLQCRAGLHRGLPHLCGAEDPRQAGGGPELRRRPRSSTTSSDDTHQRDRAADLASASATGSRASSTARRSRSTSRS